MAKRIFQCPTWAPTATADTTNLANNTHMSIGASGATAGLNVIEIYEGGQAAASAPNIMLFARDVVLAGTPTALAAPSGDGAMDTRTAALAAPPITFNFVSTTPNQRSSATAQARLNLSFNAFGGIVRWVAAPGEEWGITGITVNVSESSLSALGTGGGLMGAHLIYEPF